MTYLAIALVLSVLAIAVQMVGDAIRQSNRRHSRQLAETDRDPWVASVPRNFQTPAVRHLGKTTIGIDREAA